METDDIIMTQDDGGVRPKPSPRKLKIINQTITWAQTTNFNEFPPHIDKETRKQVEHDTSKPPVIKNNGLKNPTESDRVNFQGGAQEYPPQEARNEAQKASH